MHSFCLEKCYENTHYNAMHSNRNRLCYVNIVCHLSGAVATGAASTGDDSTSSSIDQTPTPTHFGEASGLFPGGLNPFGQDFKAVTNASIKAQGPPSTSNTEGAVTKTVQGITYVLHL